MPTVWPKGGPQEPLQSPSIRSRAPGRYVSRSARGSRHEVSVPSSEAIEAAVKRVMGFRRQPLPRPRPRMAPRIPRNGMTRKADTARKQRALRVGRTNPTAVARTRSTRPGRRLRGQRREALLATSARRLWIPFAKRHRAVIRAAMASRTNPRRRPRSARVRCCRSSRPSAGSGRAGRQRTAGAGGSAAGTARRPAACGS